MSTITDNLLRVILYISFSNDSTALKYFRNFSNERHSLKVKRSNSNKCVVKAF